MWTSQSVAHGSRTRTATMCRWQVCVCPPYVGQQGGRVCARCLFTSANGGSWRLLLCVRRCQDRQHRGRASHSAAGAQCGNARCAAGWLGRGAHTRSVTCVVVEVVGGRGGRDGVGVCLPDSQTTLEHACSTFQQRRISAVSCSLRRGSLSLGGQPVVQPVFRSL